MAKPRAPATGAVPTRGTGFTRLLRAPASAAAALLIFAAAARAAAPRPADAAARPRTFVNWTAVCPAAGAARRPLCFIMQNLALKQTGKRILSLRVGELAGNGRPMLLVTVPLGVFLPAGIELSIDGSEARRVDYQFCNAEGCSAVVALGAGTLQRLKAGREARVVFEDARERPISVPVSLLGFTAAYTHITR